MVFKKDHSSDLNFLEQETYVTTLWMVPDGFLVFGGLEKLTMGQKQRKGIISFVFSLLFLAVDMEVRFKLKNKDNPFTLSLFRSLHRKLCELKKVFTPEADETIIIAFKELAEYIGYDVRSNSQGIYFEYFIENNMFSLFLDYIKQTRSSEVTVQIIQSLSIILQNVKSPIAFNYLYSGDHINEFISTPLDFENEEIVSIYIAFLKYLSNVLNNETVHLFFHKGSSSDPFLLFSISIKFYDNKDTIIRNHVRNIILNCLRIKDEGVQEYMCSDVVLNHYSGFVLYAGSLIQMFNTLYCNYITDPMMKTGKLEQCSDTISDQLTFFNDILDIGVKEVNERICKTLFLQVLYPSALDPIINYINKTPVTSPNAINIHLGLHFITQLLLDVKYPYLTQKILSSLLSQYPLQSYKTVKSRKSSFHIPSSAITENTNVFQTADYEFTYPSDSPTDMMDPNDDLLPSAAEITIESSNRDPGMRGSLIGFIGDDDECVSIQTMLLFYAIFTNTALPPDYLSLFNLDNLVDKQTGEPSYNEYLIDMILKTLSRPQLKLITVKIGIWLLRYLLRDVKAILPKHVEAINYIMASYTISVYNNISPVYNNLLSIYLLSLYNVYTMRVDLKVECQQCIYMLPTLYDDSIPMIFENRICHDPALYLQQRIQIYMQFRNLYFEFYSQFKIPQITSIFSSPRPVTKPLVTATSIPKIYPQFSIYDLDMYKVNNIPIVVEGQIIEISKAAKYLPCNIIPPTSSYDTNSRAPSNRPCYLAVGRTQLILLELAKGSLKEGTCICSFFLNEIIEAEIEEGRRILMIKIRSPVFISSTTYINPNSDLYNRKNIPIYVLKLLFTRTDLCISAQKLISIARNSNINQKTEEIYKFFENSTGISVDEDVDISPYAG